MINFVLFCIALGVTLRAAYGASEQASSFAQALRLSRYTVGVILIAILSVMPETLVSVSSALQGQPMLGFSTLIGSNIADITLILGIVSLFAHKKMVVDKTVLNSSVFYLLLICIPVALAFDGNLSRIDGLILVSAGGAFMYAMALREKKKVLQAHASFSVRRFASLVLNIALLLLGSHFTVKYALNFAEYLSIDPIVIGMFVLGLGTTLPELMFSVQAARKGQNNLAFGDIIGTVVLDATLIIGLVTLVSPFSVPLEFLFVIGIFMIISAIICFLFLNTRQTLTKIEGMFLILLYIAFICFELMSTKLSNVFDSIFGV